jgi:FtsP/CotA-like multicopper oxidase with cupredoxin domain
MKKTASVILASAIAIGAHAQTMSQVGNCPFDRPLVEPPVLQAVNGKVETTLTLRLANVALPLWINVAPFGQPANYQCSMVTMPIRRYSWPIAGETVSGFPGPTLKVRKASSRQTVGDSLTVHLNNELPVGPNDQCNEGCDCSNPSNLARCCLAKDVFPACFHGDNNTNLHFHGTHVSPQAPQDYVLLELRPRGASTDSAATHHHGTVAAGSYDYVVDPFRYTQPEGTHWYHPHKHGSTALQVGNGLAGALIIEGKFDDDLRALFGGALKENLLVLQVVHPLNFTVANSVAVQPLINGQPSPVIDMYPGEIRRLRVIAATIQADGAVTVDFNGPDDDPVEVMQIAMDGIQFAPENYERQPLVDAGKHIDLAPGNRADFLVKAPMTAGTYDVTYTLPVVDPTLRGQNSNDIDLGSVIDAIAPGPAEPRLFRIRVTPCMQGQSCPPMSFPKTADFPKLPDYLADIPAQDVSTRRNLFFELADPGDKNPLPPNKIPSQPSKFFINLAPKEGRQFNPECNDITMRLGATEEWTIYNTSRREPIKPLHIFHIHTNPFQVIKNPTKPKMNTPPYVWQDSVLLPDYTQGPIVIRQRYEDFTGAYVLHCHFLGHEDRGMMLGVQVTCPDNGKFGKPGAGPDDCKADNLADAIPDCSYTAPRHRVAHAH